MSLARRSVEFFYCAACPWSYLAFVRLSESVLRTDASISYRPIVAAWLGTDQAGRHSFATADYVRKDLQDWARFCGVRIVSAEPFSAAPEQAQRGAFAAARMGNARDYIGAIYRAQFERQVDIAGRATLLAIADECGLDLAQFQATLDDAASLEAVRHNSEELRQRGGFGSPSMFVGGDLYFGHDRLPLVESALLRAGERPFVAPGEHDRP